MSFEKNIDTNDFELDPGVEADDAKDKEGEPEENEFEAGNDEEEAEE
jgi:hypothetical protein